MELGKRDVERMVHELLRGFEEALVERVDLEMPSLQTILLALDRSDQDPLAVDLASFLARRHGARVVITGGFPEDVRGEAETYIRQVEADLQARGAEARSLWPRGAESFDRILGAIEESTADLLILPSPYLRDLKALGENSVGTNLDVLLLRSPVPLLVVRQPNMEAKRVLGHILLTVFDDSPLTRLAAEWALLISTGGHLEALALVEEEFLERVEDLVEEEVEEEELVRRLSHELVPLMSAVLRRCSEQRISCETDYVTGDLVETITSRLGRRQGLIVLRGYSREDPPAEKVARDVIPRSRHPVLVVKGGARDAKLRRR